MSQKKKEGKKEGKKENKTYRENTYLLFGEESPTLRKRFVETVGTKNNLPRPT